jgi:hypothetical protein
VREAEEYCGQSDEEEDRFVIPFIADEVDTEEEEEAAAAAAPIKLATIEFVSC